MKLSSRLRKMFQRRETRTFGVSLDVLHKRDGSEVPKIVKRLCEHILNDGIAREGLFRTPGNARIIRELEHSINERREVDLESNNISAACSLLKKFLRDLPEPIIPQENQVDLLLNHFSKNEETDSADDITRIIEELPSQNKATINYLFDFLVEISKNAEKNKMDIANIAVCLGPCIFQVDPTGVEQQQQLNTILEIMLNHHYDISLPQEEDPQEEDPDSSSERRLVEIASEMEELAKQLEGYKTLFALKEKQFEAEKWFYKENLKTKQEKIRRYEKQLAEKNEIITRYQVPKNRPLDAHLAQLMLAKHVGDVDGERAITGMLHSRMVRRF